MRDHAKAYSATQTRTRIWPIVVLFVAFVNGFAACHWPYPDPREPIIESNGRDSKAQESAAAEPPAPASNASEAEK